MRSTVTMVLPKMPSVPSVISIASLALTLGGACVWTNGNPVLAPPRIEDHIFSAPPLPPPPIGWADRVAPTNAEAAQLDVIRLTAEVHRGASQELREAESTACAGISGDDLVVSPFFHRRDLVDALALRAADGSYPGRLEGAIVVFRKIEGLSVERLQHLLECHVVRDAALHYAASEMRWCPLDVQGILPRVVEGERGLEVRLAAGDRDAAAESFLRATALLAP